MLEQMVEPREFHDRVPRVPRTIERLIPEIALRFRRRIDRMMTRYRGTPFGDEYAAARRVVDPRRGTPDA